MAIFFSSLYVCIYTSFLSLQLLLVLNRLVKSLNHGQGGISSVVCYNIVCVIYIFFFFCLKCWHLLYDRFSVGSIPIIFAATSEHVPSDMCAQRRFRFAQSDQNLHWAHFGRPRTQKMFMRITMTLISQRGCAGWFQSSMGVHARKYVLSYCGS